VARVSGVKLRRKKPTINVQAVWNEGLAELNIAMGPIMDMLEHDDVTNLNSEFLLPHLASAWSAFIILAQFDVSSEVTVPLADGVASITNGLENGESATFEAGWEQVKAVLAKIYPQDPAS
jgi:hypothetical protein